jgi:hypothetical protein
MSTRDGVLPRKWDVTNLWTDLRTSAAGGSNTQVAVQPGYAIISRSGQASYLWMLETATTITLSNSDVTNPRIDVVCATAYDQVAFGGDAQHGAYITVVEGTPSGSPVAPTIPPGSLVLDQWLRPANNNTTPGTRTGKRKSTALHGTPRILIEGDLTSDTGNYAGERRWRTFGSAGRFLEVWDGTAWQVETYSGDGSHYWTGAVTANATTSLTSYNTCTNFAQSRSAGLATMTSATTLKLNQPGKWSVMLVAQTNTPGPGTCRAKIDWPSGAPNSQSIRMSTPAGSGTTNAGITDFLATWVGYVNASQAPAGMTVQANWNPQTGSATTSYAFTLGAEYLGG